MSEISGLNCPNCGASVEPGGTACAFCGSTFVIKGNNRDITLTERKCGSCGTLNPPDSAFCENCSEMLLDSCRNCKKQIPVSSSSCRFCGTPYIPKKKKSNPGFEKAMELSEQGDFSDADELFSKNEKKNKDNPHFYAGWIMNYMNWGLSFKDDVTMQAFVHEYRAKALELVELVEDRFSDDATFQKACEFVHNDKMPKTVNKPVAGSSAAGFKFLVFIVALIIILASDWDEGIKVVLVLMIIVGSIVSSLRKKRKDKGGQ